MTTSAREQSCRLADLLRREHSAMADFLVALATFDRARGWIELGYASLFNYLHQDLGLSKGAAFYRMTAAHLIQEHPEVVEPLRDGRLCLTTIVELSKALTGGKPEDVLPRFIGLSKREAKAVTAELVPETTVPRRVVVTEVSAPTATLALTSPAPDASQTVHLANHSADPGQAVHPANLGVAPAPSAPPSAPVFVEEPKTAELSRIHLTVARRFLEKLEAARAALSHSHPGAREDDILEVGLNLILERHAKRRGLVARPRPPKTKPAAVARVAASSSEPSASGAAPRRPMKAPKREPVPADVKRAVWLRDGGRCQWPLSGGGVCGSTLRVEIDHVVPVALGGCSTVDNCRLTCRPHNDLAARQVFGDDHMDQFTGHGRLRADGPAPGQ